MLNPALLAAANRALPACPDPVRRAFKMLAEEAADAQPPKALAEALAKAQSDLAAARREVANLRAQLRTHDASNAALRARVTALEAEALKANVPPVDRSPEQLGTAIVRRVAEAHGVMPAMLRVRTSRHSRVTAAKRDAALELQAAGVRAEVAGPPLGIAPISFWSLCARVRRQNVNG